MSVTNPIWFGGDYNPEQWEKRVWDEDMRLFKKAGINTVTINVFSWALLEPEEGHYDFSMLDAIIEKVTQNGMRFILATSTAALPAWLCKQYPEVTRVDAQGKKRKFGGRHNHCPNSGKFQERAAALVERIASRYAGHSAMVAWHVSNEYGGTCYCENCERAFRIWLQKKYGTIERVNEAWGTTFWSHTFHDFDEIVAPSHLADGMSNGKAVLSGLAMDYRRFNSDALLDNYKMERDIIRRYDAKTPITTNLMGAFKDLDYFRWAREMDIVSWDNYPSLDTPVAYTAMMHDLMRGLKAGQPFLLMEQTPNQQNWQPYNSLKRPGVMALMSYQAMAHGADSVLYFQLRQSRNGCEKFHGAVISHMGSEQSRVFKEVERLGGELESLEGIQGSKIEADTAILFDWNSWWGIDFTVGPSTRLDYVQEVYRWYKALHSRNIAVDMVGADQDFSKYKLLILPMTYVCDERLTEKLETFVNQGGHLVTTTMSGMVDETDNVHLGGYPGLWHRLCGLKVDEIDALFPDHPVSIDLLGHAVRGEILADLILPDSAKAIGVYTSEFYAGSPAVCENRFGQGRCVYVGTMLDQAGMDVLMEDVLDQAGVAWNPADGVEIVSRVKNGERFTFYLNHADLPKTVDGLFELAPYEVRIVREHIE
ncbi:beta-galactosidase [uncultured Dubosiella sp.]|uniref:beta-galactosidase n=4 Tax=uncultured Dubosiella sp. TaxID=1937011 RepID=UPI0025930597|nr:beta-galactosidase [uncultured Dubosiella sp.]